MLREIDISGLAIIDQSHIEFGEGLNIITGETGAGKSIIIKALGLLLGAKTDATYIRSDREQASVSAEFDISTDMPIYKLAHDLGVMSNGERTLLLRRVVFKNGRSKAWINDQPVTLQSMKTLSEELLDLFSQHESHAMLNAKHHLGYVDQFMVNKDIHLEYTHLYKTVQKALKELQSNLTTLLKLKKEEDYLSFRFKELDSLGPSVKDYDELYSRIASLENAHSHKEWLAEATQIIESASELQHGLERVEKLALNLAEGDSKFQEFADSAKNAVEALNDLSYVSSRLGSHDQEDDENELEAIRERISEYKDLMRKTGAESIEELVARHNELEQQINSISELESQVSQHLETIRTHCTTLQNLARRQFSEREKAAKLVSRSIEQELKSLVMPNAKVDVEFSSVNSALQFEDCHWLAAKEQKLMTDVAETLTTLNSQGSEQAQFLLSANPGEKLRPLQKVVSGGELSRIMLALKKALSAGANTCVLVFDEIDTGISGQIADVVGKKLKALSEKFQIICISHLPQVAVYADDHFLVSKSQTKKKTETSFEKLDNKAREREIARLLSGPELTDSSLKNARSLLSKAR